ncbi:AraC family transcriptional regulator [Metapseudomonas lalkuanensis]|uniref:AraC family transcriptional regulator n=1 Tax=Metapseudomonas lalkuanensis TaxID=2604832 RepID=A0A5J6QGE2_9GAMM|nr:AraC family transcriptional regulator [Pseudomonas lalkuanensis]QEY61610.1 AraC family transcriptional regulator [Pseudomonas lalkuanensis]UCO99374.1 AraC family transcriptional regulator [Pseudomonas lalkuanensis]
MSEQREDAHFWQAGHLDGLELLSARYIEHRFAPHVHDGYVIAVVEAGAERYRYRGVDHLAGAGSLALINPDEVHTGSKGHDDGWRYRVFYPDVALVRSALEELELPLAGMPAFIGSVHHDPDLVRMFTHLHRLLEANASALEQQTAWREALLALFRRHSRLPEPGAPGREPLAVLHAKELLRERLAEPPSLEELASAVRLSPFHFARTFRRSTGMPPHAWLKQQRLDQARALLRAGCTPAGVAAQLGFADQSHLTRQFKQAYGVGPGEYRNACARSFKTH